MTLKNSIKSGPIGDFASQQVDAAIADYLESVERGAPFNRAVFVAQHPEIAAELHEFLADYQAFEQVAPRGAANRSTDGAAISTGANSRPRVAPLASPRQFGNFELLEEIARGGMGVVYKARQATPDRIVALKMILTGQLASKVDVDRFYTEAHTAAALDHPNIVPIFEVGEYEGQHYFTMAFIEGQSLGQRLVGGPLPSRDAATIIRDVALAVEYAHQHGVIHRDLKPANFLFDNGGRVRVTDFGLAKRQADDSGLTHTGELLGTPSFMSPEQVTGDTARIGPASDIYSLGATLYALLTGRPPFQAASTVDTLKQVIDQEPVPPRELDITIPRDIETIALKCLEKDSRRRYESAGAIALDIDRFLNDKPVEACPPSTAYRLKKFVRRNKKGVIAVSAIVIALSLGIVVSTWQAIRADREAKNARAQATRSKQIAHFLKDTLATAGPSVARGRDATLLREILDHTSERVEKELADQPEVQGDLWFMLGSVYEDISDDSRGIDMFQSAADSYRIALGEENIKRARALARVGSMKSMTGDAVTGKKTAQLAVDIARGCGDPVVLAECLYHRAVASRIYGWSGRTGPEDLPLLRESVDLFRQTDTDPVGLIQALNRLGYSTPDRVEAESLLREALALGRQYLPPDHPEIGNLLGNLGAILIERGQLGEAEETLRQSVELHRKLHANGNPHHKAPRLRLITALALGGKWDEAEAISRESLETSTANGESHRYFCLVLVRLLASRGKLDAALVESARSLEKFPRDKYLGIQRCSVLLQAGQEEECRHLCHQLLQNAKSPLANVFVAKLACLLPVEGDDFERACQWANASVSSADLKLDVGVDIDYRLAQAMAEYRRGHYDSVNGWVSGAIEERLGGPSIVQAKFLQAMVHARLRQAELARKALVEGDELLRKPHVDLLTPYGSACLGGWYLAELLRKEAANLIDSGNQASARE